MIVWFCGKPGSGKSTLAEALRERDPEHVIVLDADVMRQGPCKDLGFTDEGRRENIRRLLVMADALEQRPVHTVIVTAVTPYHSLQEMVADYACNLVYLKGQTTGMWKGTRFEEPENPVLVLDTYANSIVECVKQVEDSWEDWPLSYAI